MTVGEHLDVVDFLDILLPYLDRARPIFEPGPVDHLPELLRLRLQENSPQVLNEGLLEEDDALTLRLVHEDGVEVEDEELDLLAHVGSDAGLESLLDHHDVRLDE